MKAVRAAVDAKRVRPGARRLLPQWIARLVAFVALGSIGALEWQRLVGGLSSGRALLWVAVAAGAAVAVPAAGRAGAGWRRSVALGVVVVGAVLAGYVASGTSLALLKPHNWDDLVSGLALGTQALGTVRLPYVSADPWPAIALELLGAELLVLAGLLTLWPRTPRERSPLAPPDRGFPFIALAVLMIVVASPVVSLGGTRSLALGVVLAALTVCFLWLERLPLRPGVGVGALLAVALAGALPLAAVADRGEPWFDYRSFAEGLGPDDPVHFDWSQRYGPIDWPRNGNEVMRVKSSDPLYWKARDLDVFNGTAWQVRRDATPTNSNGDQSWEADMPEDWRDRPVWTSTISVSIRRMQATTVIGAGTTVAVDEASRDIKPGLASGTWDSTGALRRGDSYTAQVHVPQPSPTELAAASTGVAQRQTGELSMTIPLRPGSGTRTAVLRVNPWSAAVGGSTVSYPGTSRFGRTDVDKVMRRSLYARTWRLAQRLRRGVKQPYVYIQKVDAFLHGKEFRYDEHPPPTPVGEAPLDFFLNESHAGYCQHYAGAMALLLRMGGIPARVATGFSPGGYSKSHGAWIVRDTDAHAWVEAWFDRYGWVTLDPTPDATPARSQVFALTPSSTGAPLAPDRVTPSANNSGSGTAPGTHGLRAELLLDRGNGGSGGGLEEAGVSLWIWAGGGVALVLLLTWVVVLVRRPRGAVAELEDALRRVGRPVSTGTTLYQLERRLGSHSPEAASYLRSLTAGRYAPSALKPTRAGRRALRRALAQGLGPTGRVRAFWALPPRI